MLIYSKDISILDSNEFAMPRASKDPPKAVLNEHYALEPHIGMGKATR